jgi:hypothetical protein
MSTAPSINHRHIIVRLATGPLYQNDTEHWRVLLDATERIRAHYADMGLEVVIDESGGYAYLRQLPEESGDTWSADTLAPLPRILRRTPLSYHQTLLLVLLRERLLRHEQLPDSDASLYLDLKEITEMLRPYYPESGDDKKFAGRVLALIARFEALSLVSPMKNRSESIYRIEPIIKARLPAESIAEIRKRLAAEADPSTAPAPEDSAPANSTSVEIEN